MHLVALTVLGCFSIWSVSGGEPVVNCPAPRSPDHGQAFLYHDGTVVKYVCDPGFSLRGRETIRCLGGQWEEEGTLCAPTDVPVEKNPNDSAPELLAPRPLFDWGGEDKENETELAQGDEARLRVLLYPRRRAQLISRAQVMVPSTARVHSATELEEEEQQRKKSSKKEEKSSSTSTTIHLQSPPPSVVYVRRTVSPDKSEGHLTQQYRTATVHLATDEAKDQVEIVQLPRQPVTQSDKGEDALYRSYLWAAQHYLPRSASLVEYRAAGSPVAMTLTDSQIAWINSLHPELRDRYLRDLYVLRADEAVEGVRAQDFIRRYNPYYPYYVRQPLAMIQEVTHLYDYSCNQAGTPFIRAPKLSNAHIARYDRRQNQNPPHNHYLAAVYRCNPDHVMLDTRFTELYCSRGSWVGTQPICVPRA